MADTPSPYDGETPVSPDDAAAFVDGVAFETLDDVYQAEAQAIAEVREELYEAIADGQLTTRELTDRYTLEKIHEQANAGIWSWAGRIRTSEVSIGAAPENIRDQLYGELDNLRWQTEHPEVHGLTPEAVAMAAHHHLVKIHPFVDGNGRITRLFADLLLFALTGDRVFDWPDGPEYFAALRRADASMNPVELVELVGIERLAD